MNSRTELPSTIEVSLIRADLLFFVDFLYNPAFERIRIVALNALFPYMSAFIVESSKWVSDQDLLDETRITPHKKLLTASRQCLKTFSDLNLSSSEILAKLVESTSNYRAWLISRQKSNCSLSERISDKDMTLYLLEEQIVCVSHFCFYNLGIANESISGFDPAIIELADQLGNVSSDLGSFVNMLSGVIGTPVNEITVVESDQSVSWRLRDESWVRFYNTMAAKFAPGNREFCLLATFMLTQVNTARVLVPLVASNNDFAAVKFGFLTLFHIVEALNVIVSIDSRVPCLDPTARAVLRSLQGNDAIKLTKKRSNLRNNLIHYKVDRRLSEKLNPDLPMLGLVEASTGGIPFYQMQSNIKEGLDEIARCLSQFIPRSLFGPRSILGN